MIPLVSIVVPMYNAETHLNQMLNSLLNQTYKNIEILIVDDGSTDQSSTIVLENDADGRLKYIYQENSGAPAARNAGLKQAQGEYILFFDADDEMDLQGIEELMRLVLIDEADIVIGNFIKIDEVGKVLENDTLTPILTLLKGEEDADQRLRLMAYMDPLPGNKLFKREFLTKNHLWFSDLKIAQDVNFFLKAIGCRPKIHLADAVVFSYRIHEGTISRKYTSNILDVIQCFKEIDDYSFHFYLSFPKVIETNKFNHYSYQLYKLPFFTSKKERKRAHKKLRAAFEAIDMNLVEVPFVTVSQRKVRAAIYFGQLYTSDWFAHYFHK